MIQTGYFALYEGDSGISIARSMPKGYKPLRNEIPATSVDVNMMPEYSLLFPPGHLLRKYKNGEVSKREYASIYYDEVLSNLDPIRTAKVLDGKVLLCWENYNDFCHRFIVAKWLERHTGIPVTEWDKIPF